MGLPVSGWLNPGSFDLNLTLTTPALNYVRDGVLDISLEVSGPARAQYQPYPAFLHLQRGRTVSPLVPMMVDDQLSTPVWIPHVIRIDRRDRMIPVYGEKLLMTYTVRIAFTGRIAFNVLQEAGVYNMLLRCKAKLSRKQLNVVS